MEVKRPKRIDEEGEEELLKFQEEFLRTCKTQPVKVKKNVVDLSSRDKDCKKIDSVANK